MLKRLVLLFVLCALSASAQDYVSFRRETFSAVANGSAVRLIGSAASYHKLTWTKVGTVTVCSIKVQQSATGAFAGEETDLITTQNCSSSGTSSIVTAVPNYVRVITHTTFTGTGSIVAVYTGYINDPSGGGVGSASDGQVLVNSSGSVVGKDISGAGDALLAVTCTVALGKVAVYDSVDARWECVQPEVVVPLVVVDFATDTAVGDGKYYFVIPVELNGLNLIRVRAEVVSVGTTGTLNFDLARCAVVATGSLCSGTVVDMLSVNGTIDTGEASTDTAATALTIDTANDDVATGQVVRVDIDAVHTTAAKGLLLTLTFQKP